MNANVDDSGPAAALSAFLRQHPKLLLLTGAGCSTESGIPDYRDVDGAWKRPQPVQFQDFMRSEHARRRYWARSMLGYPLMAAAQPNAAHRWLADLERQGRVELLITQNVDGLHQQAGQRAVVDLHGRIAQVLCTACGVRLSRDLLQTRVESLNPWIRELGAAIGPDGDADIEHVSLESFRVPACDVCGGILKPDVVFFGENVPRQRVERSMAALEQVDALLVMGSSLKLFSGYRFCREAKRLGLPMAAVNLGRTRIDDMLDVKVEAPCGELCATMLSGVYGAGGSSGDYCAA